MYQYGYYVAGEKFIIGTVGQDEFEGKQKEIDWANKIDSGSRWFIEEIQQRVHVGTPHEHLQAEFDYLCAECGELVKHG